jgi:hypothetical protein
MVESGANDNAIGSRGEVSRYQILPHIWRLYAPLKQARYHKMSSYVAQILLADIRHDIATDDPLLVASAWNYGSWRIVRAQRQFGRLPKRVQAYALRVKNLYELYNKHQFATVPLPRVDVQNVRTANCVRGSNIPITFKVDAPTGHVH